MVFGLSIVLVNDRTFFIADTAINSAPNAQQIAQIAIKSANTVKSMGHKPSVAIIAHSNFGSSDDIGSVCKSKRSRIC